MKGKNITRIIILTLIIIFIALYLTQVTGYYEYDENKKTTLTSKAIEKFEKDVSEGKDIKASSYLTKDKNYSNGASTIGMKISNIIEDGFNSIMNLLFKEVDKAVKSTEN